MEVSFLTEEKIQGADSAQLMQHIGLLNVRVNDMMSELNTVMKMMMEENASLRKENADLKAKQQKTTKQ